MERKHVKHEEIVKKCHREEGVKWTVKARRRAAVKQKKLSVPKLLLESASVATAWLTTGTVYFQRTAICGYLNLDLDPL